MRKPRWSMKTSSIDNAMPPFVDLLGSSARQSTPAARRGVDEGAGQPAALPAAVPVRHWDRGPRPHRRGSSCGKLWRAHGWPRCPGAWTRQRSRRSFLLVLRFPWVDSMITNLFALGTLTWGYGRDPIIRRGELGSSGVPCGAAGRRPRERHKEPLWKCTV